QTVSDPVNGLVTQVSTLASGFNVLVKDFEDLEVGGRNLIVSSGVTPNSYVGSDGSLSSGAGYFLTDFIEVKANEFYTISMLLQGNGYSRIAYYDLDKNFIKRDLFQNQEVTQIKPEQDGFIRWSPDVDMAISDYGPGYKIEKGNKATDWTPAPEDMATQAQLSVLNDNINMRVSKGELMSKINIEAGRTLIQSDKLYLDSSSVVFSGKAFIPGAVIENASIDGAKIANATIGSAKIANLDVNKISGNKAQLVKAGFNGISSSLTIDYRGLTIKRSE